MRNLIIGLLIGMSISVIAGQVAVPVEIPAVTVQSTRFEKSIVLLGGVSGQTLTITATGMSDVAFSIPANKTADVTVQAYVNIK